MADEPIESPQDGNLVPQEGAESDAPRREASVRFKVEGAVGGEAALREAMDPANQSLAEALRLSYRVLQLAILGLLVTFFFSGFQTIKEGYTGVRTVFGAIQGGGGDEQLAPGLEPFWPYPVGEIIVFQVKQSLELRSEFWPRLARDTVTLARAIQTADTMTPIRPGADGSLLTADGDVAHLQIAAEYTIDNVSDYLGRVEQAKTDQLVRMALARGAVHAAASMTLADLLADRDQPVKREGQPGSSETPAGSAPAGAPAGAPATGGSKPAASSGAAGGSAAGGGAAAATDASSGAAAKAGAQAGDSSADREQRRSSRRSEIERAIQAKAQEVLDSAKCGIKLVSVAVPQRIAPLAVENAFAQVQVAREQAKEAVDHAQQEARVKLLGAAGNAFPAILDGIHEYEAALIAGDTEKADATLKRLGKRLEEPDVGGEASQIVNRAKAYQGTIEATLGAEARRVSGLAQSYHDNPKQLVRQLWLDALRQVFENKETEVFSVPLDAASVQLTASSSPDVAQFRRESELKRKKADSDAANMLFGQFWQPGVKNIVLDKAGRKLDANGQPVNP